MKLKIFITIILILPISKIFASGYEFHEKVIAIEFGSLSLGIVNYKHLSTSDLQGKLLLEPLCSLTLPVKGETFIIILSAIILCAFTIIKNHRKGKTA